MHWYCKRWCLLILLSLINVKLTNSPAHHACKDILTYSSLISTFKPLKASKSKQCSQCGSAACQSGSTISCLSTQRQHLCNQKGSVAKLVLQAAQRQFGRTRACPALMVAGVLPESQRLVSPLSADLGYFNPEPQPLFLHLSLSLSLVAVLNSWGCHSGKFELWQLQWWGLMSG